MRYSEVFSKKISKVVELSTRVSTETKHVVFCNFYGHTGTLEVVVYLNGWYFGKAADIRTHISDGRFEKVPRGGFAAALVRNNTRLDNIIEKLNGLLESKAFKPEQLRIFEDEKFVDPNSGIPIGEFADKVLLGKVPQDTKILAHVNGRVVAESLVLLPDLFESGEYQKIYKAELVQEIRIIEVGE